ncbi:DUF308 domain-containing protein [Microbacterium sp. ZXX196]|uniref:DUF308 domain-containing protein n=1 Tax=Microbacterium sp. ZXX196 TaxID=2609291 RepID=UPI0012B7F448|nr:DUF308 domain-containing protein [Microbacterium sp. ZXX196]MTE22703.1 hypothetical protein [Microbacterium sp. ZXX196]
MTTPTPPAGFPQDPSPAGATAPPASPYPAPAYPAAPGEPPQAGPAPRERPGRTLPVLALVFAILGAALLSAGFFVFLPGAGVIGAISLIGWPFLIAGLVLAIVALARRAAGKGMSIAALIVAIAGGVVGIVSGVVVAIAAIFGVASTAIDEYGDLVPPSPESSVPDSSGSDVEADCALLLGVDPGVLGSASAVDEIFDDLADQMTTSEVRAPLEDLADAYEDLLDFDSPAEMQEATAQMERASTELAAVCGVDLGGLE